MLKFFGSKLFTDLMLWVAISSFFAIVWKSPIPFGVTFWALGIGTTGFILGRAAASVLEN